jgi:23S rRNA pseudouridine2605 synthase
MNAKPKDLAQTTSNGDSGGDRIAKWLARAGVASRRDIERMIAEGRVQVDGAVLTTPAFKVAEGMKIVVDGKAIGEQEPPRLWRYHKPAGLVTSHKDPEGRQTVFAVLPTSLPRVISVGRLDYNSEGLLLLTNDGGLARRLELPASGWIRRYRARVFGKLEQRDLDRLKSGVTVDGVAYGPVEAIIDRPHATYPWVTVAIREGKNREVRRLMEYLGVRVARLMRLSFGPFMLGQLKPGEVEEVPARVMKATLGIEGVKALAQSEPSSVATPSPAAASRPMKKKPFRPAWTTSDSQRDAKGPPRRGPKR